MTEAVKLVTFLNVVFILILALSSSFGGFVGECVYYLAFAIPVVVGFYSSSALKTKREEIKGVAEPQERFFAFGKEKAIKLLPLIAPVVLTVFLASLLTSIVLSFVGVSSLPVEDTGIFNMLLAHALLPAVFEEVLFRYIPLKILLPYSGRWCVLYSALCFSLIHCSFSQMPYAFIAGVIFMLVDVAFDSVWPSIILHFVNNSLSIVWMKYCSGAVATLVMLSVLVLITLISLFFVMRKRGEYVEMFATSFDKGEKIGLTYAPFVLALICVYIAWSSL